MLRFQCLTDNYLVFENYAHGRYALNGRIRITCNPFAYLPRVTGSLTHMFPFPFHVSLYFTVMDC